MEAKNQGRERSSESCNERGREAAGLNETARAARCNARVSRGNAWCAQETCCVRNVVGRKKLCVLGRGGRTVRCPSFCLREQDGVLCPRPPLRYRGAAGMEPALPCPSPRA